MKYDSLRLRLQELGDCPVTLSFAEIGQIVGELPASATQHRAWWGNHAGNPQAQAWLSAGRRVETVVLDSQRVRFSAPTSMTGTKDDAEDAAIPPPATPPVNPVAIRWNDVWHQVAEDLAAHLEASRGHLITEDVVRFATALALQGVGVPAESIRFEQRVADIAASLDLVIGDVDAVIELKYPRDPEGAGAADTMTFGELLRDFYRLAWLSDCETWPPTRPRLSPDD